MNEKLLNCYTEIIMAKIYGESTVIAPKYMQEAAKRGLKLREEQPKSNRCCTLTGLARANQLAKGEPISITTVKRIKSFAARHGASLKDSTEKDSKLIQSLLVWGITPTKSGIDRVIAWADKILKSL
jgi:hypothetical protein